MTRILQVLLVSAAFAAAAPAHAASEATQRAEHSNILLKEGERLYSAGKYREAAEALEEAYQLDPHPTLLYNIGRAYDQAGDLERALALYGQYVSDKDAESALIRKANLALDRLRLLAAKEEGNRQKEADERRRLEAETRTARAEQERMKARERAQVDDELRQSRLSKTGSYLAAGTAVAGLGLGLVFALNAGASKRAFLEAPDPDAKRRLEAETRSRALVADVSLIVAVAGAAGAVLLYPRGEEGLEGSMALSLSPFGASLAVRF